MSLIKINESFADKSILLVGSTGFIGKVLLHMMLDKITSIKKIFLLIRKDKKHSASERLETIFLNSPVFHQISTKYPDYLKEKLVVLEGDITQPKLGFSSENYQFLKTHCDLIINAAGDVDFFLPLDEAFNTNVKGVLNIIDFLKDSKETFLVHLSTCYVAGSFSGVFKEQLVNEQGRPNISIKKQLLYSEKLNERIEKTGHSVTARKKRFSRWHARRLNFPNTYTLGKFLGELAIMENVKPEKYCILRPAVVEASIQYPFPAWNEGFNTCAPLVYLQKFSPFLSGDPDVTIDIVPVDEVCKSIILCSSGLISHSLEQRVFHCASSIVNPFKLHQAVNYSRQWFKESETFNPVKKLWFAQKGIFVQDNSAFSWSSIHGFANYLSKIRFLNKAKFMMKFVKATEIFSSIEQTYQPFIREYEYKFESCSLLKMIPDEPFFTLKWDTIDWKKYWHNNQMPSLKRWVFTKLHSQ